MTDADLRGVLPVLRTVTPVASPDGQLILRGTADVLGAAFSVDFSVRVTPAGALVVSPDVPFGGVATITVFSDPAVRVTSVSAAAVSGGFTSARRARCSERGAVIDVQRLELTRAFYVACLGLVVVEHDDTTVMLRSDEWTLHLVTVPAAVAATIELSEPPRRRAESPLKPVFEVVGIEALRGRIAELGGKARPAGTRPFVRRRLALDAVDPEGNLIQLRETS